jgi:hypothetical protein
LVQVAPAVQVDYAEQSAAADRPRE